MSDKEGNSGSDEDAKTESKGKMVQRHKREMKELKAATTKMLHAVPKNDKKKKAEVEAQIAVMEAQMQKRHEAELADQAASSSSTSNSTPAAASPAPATASAPPAPTPAPAAAAQPKAKSKAQQKRDAKDKAELERQARVREEKANTVSARQQELDAIAKRLAPLKLEVKEIPSDGNCLFAAVADQLETMKVQKPSCSVAALRKLAASHILQHKAEYEPFLLAAEDGLVEGGLEGYCTRLETTPLWGGEVEIRALSESLQVPLLVYSADMAPHLVGSDKDAPLRLSFHKHYISMGAHYNSVVPALGEAP